jgi:hypothetical protein
MVYALMYEPGGLKTTNSIELHISYSIECESKRREAVNIWCTLMISLSMIARITDTSWEKNLLTAVQLSTVCVYHVNMFWTMQDLFPFLLAGLVLLQYDYRIGSCTPNPE